MEKSRKDKGITLIALIITIIVLLILALVTINAIQGDGDLIAHANNAKKLYSQEGENENAFVQNSLTKIKKYIGEDIAGNESEGSATFSDGVTLTWKQLQDSSNGTKYGYNASLIKDNLLLFDEEEGGAFSECTDLKSIIISNNVTSIGDCTFMECTNLNNITIPNNVTSIGEMTFAECTSLTNVIIPSNVTSIGPSAFSGTGIINITIPSSVVNLANSAFQGCDSLTDVIIENGIESIAKSIFEDCDSLKNVTIPESVTSIEKFAFNHCKRLTNITYIVSTPYTSLSAFEQAFNGEIADGAFNDTGEFDNT